MKKTYEKKIILEILENSESKLTPLNLIRLEARGLLDGITLPSQGATRIIDEIDQMKHLIDDLDWLAETDSGEYKLKRKIVLPGSIITKEVENWIIKGAAEGKDVLLVDLPRSLPLFYVDPLRFRQALGNLIENSLKYSREKSSVEISCSLEKNYAVISVKDKGPGIDSENKPYIFERFYRADPARTPHKGGRGLGLAIVKQIIELHGGQVRFTSLTNEGSTFFISLPFSNHQLNV